MKYRTIVFYVLINLIAFSAIGYAQYNTDLDSLVLGHYDGEWFGSQHIGVIQMIVFDKSVTTIINKRSGRDTIDLIITHIRRNDPEQFFIKFEPGPSADPCYLFYRIKGNDTIYTGKLGADVVRIPGDGFIYVEQRSNQMFNQRRKYNIIDNKLIEVKQPFYWVGLESKLVHDVTLYSDTTMTDPVATLSKDQNVLVVLNHGDLYLIKTPLGLTGWIKINHNDDGNVIFDIFPHGD